MTPDLERLLALPVDDGLGRRPLDELRRLRRESQEWESAVSLARRLAQARLDMVGYELRRRAGTPSTEAGDEAEVPQLLFDLPEILAEAPGGSAGRALALPAPGPNGDALTALLDEAADPHELCRPHDIADDQLVELSCRLRAFEAEASQVRRALHRQLDALTAEIGRRYRDGEASIDSVLG